MARRLALFFAAILIGSCATLRPGTLAPFRVQSDAIEEPLIDMPGDPVRGREILIGRTANCLLCHAAAETGAAFMGNLGPPLSGVATRLTPGQMRLRIVDAARLNPASIMPPYYRIVGLNQVAETWRGQPILDAQQIEDVIAYLLTLRQQ